MYQPLQYKEKKKELWKAHNCHPLKTFLLPWVQIPVFLSMSMAVRQLVAFPIPFLGITGPPAAGIDREGWLWFVDLTQSDPLYILPFVLGGLYLANVEVNQSLFSFAIVNIQYMTWNLAPTKRLIIIKTLFRVFSILMITISGEVPVVDIF